MQNGKSRIKRVASAIIAGVMALQTVAPVISYADDTASSVATTDDSDAIAKDWTMYLLSPERITLLALYFARQSSPRVTLHQQNAKYRKLSNSDTIKHTGNLTLKMIKRSFFLIL